MITVARIRYSLIIAMLLLASCQGGDEQVAPAQQAIAFGADAEATRSMLVDYEQLDAVGSNFMVYAEHDNGTTSVAYMDGVVVQRGAEGWSYSPVRYWPYNGVMNFRAYYPMTANVHDASGLAMIMSYDATKEDYDLMVACEERDIVNEGKGVVELSFKHALAAVSVQVVADEGLTRTYTLKESNFTGLYSKGVLTFDNDPAVASELTACWAVSTREKTHEFGLWSGEHTLAATDTRDFFSLMLPQEINGTSIAVADRTTLHLLIDVGDGEIVIDKVLPNIVWESGKKYIYKVTMTADSEVALEVVTTEWDVVDALSGGGNIIIEN